MSPNWRFSANLGGVCFVSNMERCQSGRMGVPGKDVNPKGFREFESPSLRKIEKNAGSPEKGEIQSLRGGRHGIPPQTPPAVPSAFSLAFLGSS